MTTRQLPIVASFICVLNACAPPRTDRAPADATFSFGIIDDLDPAAPAGATVTLKFMGGAPGATTVVAKRITTPIAVDGDASDWDSVPGSTIPLAPPGAMVGMSREAWEREWAAYAQANPAVEPLPWDTGVTEATVKAAWDQENLYLLVQWADPTEDRRSMEWSYDARTATWARGSEADDKLFLSWSISSPAHDVLGCAASCHVKERLGDYSDDSHAFRTQMHTTNRGELIDGWSWHASLNDPMGIAEDDYWDEEDIRADCPDAACAGGPLEHHASYVENEDEAGTLPVWASQAGLNTSPLALFDPATGLAPSAVPFDATAAWPLDGVTLPGHVLRDPGVNRREIRVKGRWRQGVWTVEFARALVTDDPKDVQFPRIDRGAAHGESALQASYTSIAQGVFATRCVQCHGNPPTLAPVSLDPSVAYDRIVGVTSSGAPSMKLVDPFRPEASYLLLKLKGTAGAIGARMPLGGAPVPDADVAVVERWIAAGAPRN